MRRSLCLCTCICVSRYVVCPGNYVICDCRFMGQSSYCPDKNLGHSLLQQWIYWGNCPHKQPHTNYKLVWPPIPAHVPHSYSYSPPLVQLFLNRTKGTSWRHYNVVLPGLMSTGLPGLMSAGLPGNASWLVLLSGSSVVHTWSLHVLYVSTMFLLCCGLIPSTRWFVKSFS